jgi:hypothetical protein
VLGRGPGAGVRPAGPAGAGLPVPGRGVARGVSVEVSAGDGAAAAGVTGAAGAGVAGAGVVGAGAAGAALLGAGVLGAAGAAGAAATGVGRLRPGLGTGGRRVPAGAGLRVPAGPGRAGSLPAEEPLLSFSLSRRSTGGSTVDEAERTNSPMSFNIVRTVLLSTPSSFASS